MKKVQAFMFVLFLAGGLGGSAARAAQRHMSNVKALKLQQKLARKRLHMEQKAWKNSLHGQHISRAERLVVKHQYQRNMRNLRLQQKEQLQELKDQERLGKAQTRHVWSAGTMVE